MKFSPKQNLTQKSKAKQDIFTADDDEFGDWLRDEYSAVDVFRFTENDRANVLDEWIAVCRERACVELMEEYELVEKEI